MANNEFAKALKFLRENHNLPQTVVAEIADIIQSDYSAFERQKRELNLNDADNISSKVWGVHYDKFVAFSKQEVIIKDLPKPTQIAIEKYKDKPLPKSDSLLANALDELIGGEHFNTPTTSKLTHVKMGEKLKSKKTSEITSLLGRPPRNKTIKSIGKLGAQHIYIHVTHAAKFEKLSNDDLIKLIKDKEANLTLDKE